ncbi:MAG TPA: hypothetical protein DCR99_07520, partial [Thermus scotoductus]|nr:hypothetical protein [Thermus scotoductus]
EAPRPEPGLGRFWAAGLCLEARTRGQNPVVLEAPLHWAADLRLSARAASPQPGDAAALRSRHPGVPAQLWDRFGRFAGRS